MKKVIQFALILALSIGFLSACDNKKSGNSSAVYNPYDPYSPNGGGQFPSNFLFSSRAYVVDKAAYRAFLKGDFCHSKKWDCKMIDGDPVITLALSQLEIPNNQQAIAQVSLRIQADRGVFYGGPQTANYLLGIRRVNNNTQFEGNTIDRRTGNGIGQRVQFLGSGNPASGSFDLDVYYGNKLMLEARMIRRR